MFVWIQGCVDYSFIWKNSYILLGLKVEERVVGEELSDSNREDIVPRRFRIFEESANKGGFVLSMKKRTRS